MTSSNNKEQLAFDYVMQLLSAQEMRATKSLLKEDPELQKQVNYWQQNISGLDQTLTPVVPPKSVWNAIQQQIKPEKEKKFSYLWGFLGGAASFAAIAMVAFTLFFQNPYQTNIDNQWQVSMQIDSGKLTLTALSPEPMPKDKVCNLWVKNASTKWVKVSELPMKDSKVMYVKSNKKIYGMLSKKATLLISIDDIDSTEPKQKETTRTWL